MSNRPRAADLRRVALGAALAATTLAGAARAPAGAVQPAPAEATAGVTGAVSPTGGPAAPEARRVAELAADWLTRVALVDLRAVRTPTPDDHRITLALLDAALEGRPDDQDILRLAVDAAGQADEPEATTGLLRRLVALDPSDLRAQLALITARIEANQDAAGRLAAYEQFLGPRGRSLDASIRSRLALQAATLLRERGDTAGFAARLGEATALDVTHKEAAALALEFYAERVDDPAGRFELLVNLLRADPLDGRTVLAMAREAAAAGAAEQSLRLFSTAIELLLAGSGMPMVGEQDRVRLEMERSVQTWLARGPDVLFDRTLRELKSIEQVAKARQENAAAERRPAPPSASYEWVQFEASKALAEEQLRAVLAHAMGNTEAAEAAVADLNASLETLADWRLDPSRRPAFMGAEDVAESLVQWALELAWTRLWTGVQVDAAALQMADPNAPDLIAPETLGRLNGWLLLRQGKIPEAVAALTPLAEADPLAAMGLGVAAEAAGDPAGAAGHFTSVWTRLPGTVPAAWCRAQLQRLNAVVPPASPRQEEIAAMSAAVPDELLLLGERASSTRRLEKRVPLAALYVETPARRAGPLDRVLLKIRLRNVSVFPLGLSPEGPLNSRLLLAPEIESGSARLADQSIPEVARLDRALRVEPRGEVEATLWLEPGYGGWVAASTLADPTRIRWRVLQGFTLSPIGVPLPGDAGQSGESAGIVRDAVPGVAAPLADLASRVAEAQGEPFGLALLALRLRLGGAPLLARQPAPAAGEIDALVAALVARYQREDAAGRRLMLALLPTGVMAPPLQGFDRAVAAAPEADLGTALTKAVTRGVAPDDPSLAALAGRAEPRARLYADILAARLQAGGGGYALLRVTFPTREPERPRAQPAPTPAAAPAPAAAPPGPAAGGGGR